MRVVRIGVVGLGPRWDSRYRPALERLRERIRVSAIFDWVYARARLAAEQLGAVPAGGLHGLCRRADVQGVLLLDAAWAGPTVLPLVCAENKPVFVAACVGRDLALLRRIHEHAVSHGITVMPELGRRYTPASLRLQELMATRLGRPVRITVQLACATATDAQTQPLREPGRFQAVPSARSEQPGPVSIPTTPLTAASPAAASPDRATNAPQTLPTDLLVEWFDWCWYLFRSRPQQVWCRAWTDGDGDRPVRCVELRFAVPQPGGRQAERVAELRVSCPTEDPGLELSFVRPFVHVVCEFGEASLDADKQIRWTNGSEHATETLTADRSEIEVMLDHFCRRVVGGLIPVADLNDVCRSVLVAEAASESLRQNKPLTVHLWD